MEFMDVITSRRSIRKYKPDPVPDDLLMRILEAARHTPSGKNRQPYEFIVVRDPETKRRMGLNPWVEEAPVVVVGVVDPREGRCAQADGVIAFEHLILAAVDNGLGACWQGTYLGHLEEHEKVLKKALGLPEPLQIVAFTSLGYPAEEPAPRPKKTMDEMVHFERNSSS